MKCLARCFAAFLLVLGCCSCAAQEATDVSAARKVLDRYLALPHLKGPSGSEAYDRRKVDEANAMYQNRKAVLAELETMPREAVTAAGDALFKEADSEQRHEIASFLGDKIRTRACADLLFRLVQDVRHPRGETAVFYEELVRSSAVLGIRKMARRTNASSPRRIATSSGFPPEVPGLVPYLIAVVNDEAEGVRIAALFGLADARDSRAKEVLIEKLKDTSPRVRLHAACFLTEYDDDSGLPEMKEAVRRSVKTLSAGGIRFHTLDAMYFYGDAEMLLASLERITRKSFGRIPINPSVASSKQHEEEWASQYEKLLQDWNAWADAADAKP